MMDVHSQLLILGVLPKHSFGIMVAERKRVDRLVFENPARTRRPPSVLPLQKGRRVGIHQKNKFFQCTRKISLSKPAGNVGQQAKDNLRVDRCQCSFYDKYL